MWAELLTAWRSEPDRSGSPTATLAASLRSTRAPTRSFSGSTSPTPRAPWPSPAERCGLHPGSTGRSIGSSSAVHRKAADPSRLEPDRDGRRRGCALGRERGGGHGHPGRAASGTVVQAIPVGNGPSAVATGEGAVWVVNGHDGTVSRIDPATNAVTGTVRVGGEPTAVAAGDGAVGWRAARTARSRASTRRRQRWSSGSTQGTAHRRSRSRAAACGRPAAAPQATHRGGTLRVLVPAIAPKPLSIDWIDEYGYNWQALQATSLAYDGLVGYRRVSGAAGATIVGALATDAPPPSHDGLTYVFTLRRGLRYSDGRPVRPEDFRASMERFLQVTRHQFTPWFAAIVGAPRCVNRRARCDLSRGIETDPRARTITIHLTRPDGDLLHKLTQPFAFVVPSDTPRHLTGDHAPPGTGRTASQLEREPGRNPGAQSVLPIAGESGAPHRLRRPHRGRSARQAQARHREADRGCPTGDRRRHGPLRTRRQRSSAPSASGSSPLNRRASSIACRRPPPAGCSSTSAGARSTRSASAAR